MFVRSFRKSNRCLVKDAMPLRVYQMSTEPISANGDDARGRKNSMKRLDNLRRQLREGEIESGNSDLFSIKRSATSINNSWEHIINQAKEQFEQYWQPVEDRSSAILTDTFKRKHTYLRISLVERCNLRCQYCMPPDGVHLQEESKLLRADEIHRIANLFLRAGVDKVR